MHKYILLTFKLMVQLRYSYCKSCGQRTGEATVIISKCMNNFILYSPSYTPGLLAPHSEDSQPILIEGASPQG